MVEDFLQNWGYVAILALTFLEGETVVILAGIAAFQGYMQLPWVAVCAIIGTFCGDQLYYYIGRLYGTPLLDRWPTLRQKIDWAFRLLHRHQTVFILSFRFLYGVRNVSPFVIGIAGIPRLRFAVLNFLAAVIWAVCFAVGGYFFGHALERFLGEYQGPVLLVLAALVLGIGLVSWIRNRRRLARTAAVAVPPEQGSPERPPPLRQSSEPAEID